MQILFVALERLHANDVNVAEVERFFACVHPFSQRHACTARGLNADGVEARCDPNVIAARGEAEVVGVVWCEAFRAVEEGVYTCFGECRKTFNSLFEDRFEVVEVFLKLVELEGLRNTVHTPRFCLGFKGAKEDLTRVFFVIGAFIRHAEHR